MSRREAPRPWAPPALHPCCTICLRVTRLADRMEDAGLVERERDTTDRRSVPTRITPDGFRLLEALDEPVLEVHRAQRGHMTKHEVETLIDPLTMARQSR